MAHYTLVARINAGNGKFPFVTCSFRKIIGPQIWIAVSIYVLVAILRKRLGLEASLYQTLQILSVTLFEKTPILQALQTFDIDDNLLQGANQLILFNL